MTAPRIPLAGVIGYPVAHSRSPRLFAHWLKAHDLPGHYIPLEIASDKLESSLRCLPDLGFVGVNVTLPYKEKVMDLADLISDRATLIGAANTLIFRQDGKIHADNTDGYGFVENLRQGAPGWNPRLGAATVFGAGGAARAVIASLLDVGVPEIRLTNRTRIRAEKLRDDFGNRVQVHDWVKAGNIIEGSQVIINTTSLGMVGKPPFRVPLDALKPGMIVTDIVYTPLKTHLLEVAEARGCIAVDGLGMLLHQAVPGFERWFGQRPEITQSTRSAVLS
ncbi:shikimate dehydrogenase [Tropicibacter oceani]|uniref:Shikimate dehydrogenase (NADP(+)) n=1 Tax=Tropicibacter oceani TaxID=3058420 RepID=A0ABY8QKQ2_9RHOB|nr:shikimate dehydrogenase [Tropicibacter oceani]WGW04581.1 shikimate dehydrogenase [Tropicibacter oceani]